MICFLVYEQKRFKTVLIVVPAKGSRNQNDALFVIKEDCSISNSFGNAFLALPLK